MDSSALEAGRRTLFWSRTQASDDLINSPPVAEIDFRPSGPATTTSV